MKTKPTIESLDDRIVALAQSVDELTEMMQMFATSVDKRFAGVDARFVSMDQRFDCIDSRFERIESTMATKSYVDYKLADLKGDMLVGFKQSDSKMNLIADLLDRKGVFSHSEATQVQSLGAFPA